MKRSKFTAVLIALSLCCLAGIAWAQGEGYAPVPDKDPRTIAANPFIAGAYGFIWVAVVVYLVVLARGLARANAEIANLRRKLEGTNRG